MKFKRDYKHITDAAGPANNYGTGDNVRWYKIDDVLEHFGTIGKFQIKLTLMTAMLTFIAAWRILFDLFAAKSIPWTCTAAGIDKGCRDAGVDETGKLPCAVGNNQNLDQDDYNPASGLYWKFDETQISHSIVSTFDLRCHDNWKYSFTSSIYFIGAFFGVWIFGRLSDLLGRKLTLQISLAICVVQAWIIPFFNNISVYLACRFFDGAAFGGFFLIAFVLGVEYAPPKYRNAMGTGFHFITSLGMATVAAWGFVFNAWRSYAIALAVPPTIMFTLSLFFIPESPRYCLSRGKEKEALDLLQVVADTNGKTMPENCQLHEEMDTSFSFVDMLSNKKLMMCAVINMFGWFMTSMVYYMLWFSAKFLAGNIYLNATLLGAAELPGRVAAYFAMDRIGRKLSFIIAMALACACMFMSIWDDPTNRKIMYCIGKALAGTLWAVIYLYSSEMYPTIIRSLGSGIGSGAARVAALLAPFVGSLLDVSPVLPYIIVGGLALVCCGVFWLVPETTGKDLPQTVDEFENLFQPAPKRENKEDQEMQTK